ncbi:MAG: sigma 54-interacting transcriptional regulator [candidate division Zixibacteria bacterium]|nr:sigma 54-interacting transcriptional regulator [candidate division Zixibacteria bacterium]MDH3936489.1 sigma 54-interacting transcriptional regulator [candidate division Zixibacteria bacterium]MDH4034362.1 sigma 54-interacting transcriptional regulator [candidate division Zixibacteria bacterium]
MESELFGHEKGAFTDARSVKRGLFELADSGTVLVDEIGDRPLAMQAKLLRVIEEQRFKRVGGVVDIQTNARIIAATNMQLDRAVDEKRFRRDLYYRLNVIPIQIPPLRDRGSDVVLLAEFFLKRFNQQFGKNFRSITAGARELLMRYSWPGNVRELRNAIERAVLLESGHDLERGHLVLGSETSSGPMTDAHDPQLVNNGMSMDEVEADMIRRAMDASDGNQTRAAAMLGVTRDVLRYRIKKYGIGQP